MLGKYNNPSNGIFQVGAGSGDDEKSRHNALNLTAEGTLTIAPRKSSLSGYEAALKLTEKGGNTYQTLSASKLKQLLALLGGKTSTGSVDEKIATAIAEVVAQAPAKFDTLKEIAEWIGSDTTSAAEMANDIQNLKKADYLSKSEAETTYQPRGDYANNQDIVNTYATKKELEDVSGLTEEELNVIREAASKESVEAIYKYDKDNNIESGKLITEMNERIEADEKINEEIDAIKTEIGINEDGTTSDTSITKRVSNLETKVGDWDEVKDGGESISVRLREHETTLDVLKGKNEKDQSASVREIIDNYTEDSNETVFPLKTYNDVINQVCYHINQMGQLEGALDELAEKIALLENKIRIGTEEVHLLDPQLSEGQIYFQY